jgi:hypothetical protein
MSNVARERRPAAEFEPTVVHASPREVSDALMDRLAPRRARGGRRATVWELPGARVALDPERLRLTLRPGAVVVELPVVLAGDVRPLPLVTTFRVGRSLDDAVLTAEPSDRPLGDARIDARWAGLAADLVWLALLELGTRLVSARGSGAGDLVVGGVYSDGARLSFALVPRFRTM